MAVRNQSLKFIVPFAMPILLPMVLPMILLVASFQNCSQVDFTAANKGSSAGANIDGNGSPGSVPGTGGVSPCTPQQASKLRVIFVVDDSGSTKTSDAGASVRGSSAIAFLNQNLTSTNLTYSYVYFAASEGSWDFAKSAFTPSGTAKAPISAQPTQAFSAATDALGAVNNFVSNSSNGTIVNPTGTNYQAALKYVQNLVSSDQAANSGFSYAVVFMSDGQPNTGDTSSSALQADVKALVNTAGAGRLTVSTLYFNVANSNDPVEAGIMQDMATAGTGQYVNAVTNSTTLNLSSMIQNIIMVPSVACQ